MKKTKIYGKNDILLKVFVLFIPSLFFFILSLYKIHESGGISNAKGIYRFGAYIFIPINIIFIKFNQEFIIDPLKNNFDSNCNCLTINLLTGQKKYRVGFSIPISKVQDIQIIQLTKEQKQELVIHGCRFSSFLKISTIDNEENYIYVSHFSKKQIIKIKELIQNEKQKRN